MGNNDKNDELERLKKICGRRDGQSNAVGSNNSSKMIDGYMHLREEWAIFYTCAASAAPTSLTPPPSLSFCIPTLQQEATPTTIWYSSSILMNSSHPPS